MSRFSSQITQYQTNNRGKVPTTQAQWNTFITSYMKAANDTFEDPDGTAYKISETGTSLTSGTTKKITQFNSSVSGKNLDHTIYIVHKAHCEGETAAYSSGERNLAFLYQLEGAGVYCGTN